MFQSDYLLEGYKIDITSPDQFVPLFVAYLPTSLIRKGYVIEYNDIHVPVNKYNNELAGEDCKLTKEQTRLYIQKTLKQPYPKSYGLPFITNNRYNVIEIFLGKYNEGVLLNNKELCLPFCFGYIENPGSSVLTSTTYKQVETSVKNSINQIDIFTALKVKCCLVVKAKYIPLVRACVYLKQPMELPFNALQILVSSDYLLPQSIALVVKKMSSKLACDVTYLTSTEITKFVIGQKPEMSVRDRLTKALELNELEELKGSLQFADML